MVQFIRGLHNVKIRTSLQQEGIDDMAWLLERAKNIEKSLKRFGNDLVEQAREQVSNRDTPPNEENTTSNAPHHREKTKRGITTTQTIITIKIWIRDHVTNVVVEDTFNVIAHPNNKMPNHQHHQGNQALNNNNHCTAQV